MATATTPRPLTPRPYELARLRDAGSVCVVRAMREQPDPLGYEYVAKDSRVLERWPWTPETVMKYHPCPFGRVGDVVSVKEAWSPDHRNYYPFYPIVYKADGYPSGSDIQVGSIESDDRDRHGNPVRYPFRWRSPATMPLWAVRHFAVLASVRAGQVQGISHPEARETGIAKWHQSDAMGSSRALDNWCRYSRWAAIARGEPQPKSATDVGAMAMYMDAHTRNPAHKWERNPWVWVGIFELQQKAGAV